MSGGGGGGGGWGGGEYPNEFRAVFRIDSMSVAGVMFENAAVYPLHQCLQLIIYIFGTCHLSFLYF